MTVRPPERSWSVRTAPIAGYLGLVMGVGPLVHYAISALGPLVVSDLGLSATEFGLLWFVTFGAACLFTLTGGRLSDRYGARGLFLLVFGLAGLGLAAAGSAQGYVWLLAGLALAGVAQSFSNPATNSAVATVVPARSRGMVLGLKQSGVQLSQVFAGVALPPMAVAFGWRTALLVSVSIAAVGVLATFLLVPSTRATKLSAPRNQAPLSPVVGWMTAYALLMGAVTQATNVYLPLYAHTELGVSVTVAGLVAAFLGGFGVLARLVWGGLSDRINDVALPLVGVAVPASLAMVAFWWSARLGLWSLWLGAALFSIGALAANVILMVAVVRYVTWESVGRATGWVSLGLYAGFMIGPVSVGAVVDKLGYEWAWVTMLAVTVSLILISQPIRRFAATVRSPAATSYLGEVS